MNVLTRTTNSDSHDYAAEVVRSHVMLCPPVRARNCCARLVDLRSRNTVRNHSKKRINIFDASVLVVSLGHRDQTTHEQKQHNDRVTC